MAVYPKIGWAWLALCCALSLHVIDEASTGFLAVYNPTVKELRLLLPWLPLPTFRFDVWVSGLVAMILFLFLLSRPMFRGVRWARSAGCIFSVLMLANGTGHILGTVLGHTVPSVVFARPMPGFYSSPLLILSSLYLLAQLRNIGSKGELKCPIGAHPK